MADALNTRKAQSISSSPDPAAKHRDVDDESCPVQEPDNNHATSPSQVDPQEEFSGENDQVEDEAENDNGDAELDDQQSQQEISDYSDDSEDGHLDQDEDGDEDDGELEVEHSTHLIDEKTMNIKCYMAEGYDAPCKEWLDTLVVHCSIEGEEIGWGIARYIKRDKIRSDFWERMVQPCRETSSLAFELFNRYGCLRPEFKQHPVRKGSGAWGSELDIGNILLVEKVEVVRKWRHNGIERVIIEHLNRMGQSGGKDCQLDRSNKLCELDDDDLGRPDLFKPIPYPGRSASFNLLVPSWLARDVRDECRGELQSDQHRIRRESLRTSTAFFRSLGYRRVGHSDCFGLALDQTHLARKLDASEDFDPIDAPIPDDDDDEGDEEEAHVYRGGIDVELRKMKRRLPIHHAIVTLPDIECVLFLRALAFPPQDAQWSSCDSDLNNVLHIAATKLKPQSVQWLLETIAKTHKLHLAINKDGFMPLEAAQEALEINRTRLFSLRPVITSDRFVGISDEATKVLIAFRALHNTSAPTSQELEALRFGCTCGECLGGFVSPRMSLALKYQAQIHKDTLDDEIGDGEYWSSTNDCLKGHVARDIQINFRTNKSLREGFAGLFERIAACLERTEPPTPSNILIQLHEASDEWSPFIRNYLDCGGKVEDALRVVFEFARAQDEYAGDGEAWKLWKDDFEKLKTCRNDHEFGFVALLCDIPDL